MCKQSGTTANFYNVIPAKTSSSFSKNMIVFLKNTIMFSKKDDDVLKIHLSSGSSLVELLSIHIFL